MEPHSMPCSIASGSSWYWQLSICYVIVALVFLLLNFAFPATRKTQFLLLALLLIGPPGWFFFQFNHLYLPAVPSVSRELPICETFKYNQDLAAKFWAGVSALVLAASIKKTGNDAA